VATVRARRFAWLAVVLFAPVDALAQTTSKSLAEALFVEGRDLLAAGKTEEACAKFEASVNIERKLGTLLNLASCHEAIGKTATAWSEFTDAAVLAARSGQTERAEYAMQHAKELGPGLSRIEIVVDGADPVDVRLDSVEIVHAALGTPLPVDPGPHELVASASGKRSWMSTVIVVAGAPVQTIHVPALVSERPSPPEATPAPSLPPKELPTTTRVPGWIALGVGAVAVGTGSYFGVRALAKKHDGDAECDATGCSQHGLDLFDQMNASATASTIAFGVAIAAAGIGTYLLVRPVKTSRGSQRPPPAVSVGRVGFAF
jgi:hypothetical protein